MKHLAFTAAAALAAAPAIAQDGDPAAGESAFAQCRACHSIEGPDETIQAGGQIGPNLYGLAGRTAGSVEGFDYSDSLAAAGEAGLTWDADSFADYVADPAGFLQDYLDDESASTNMTFQFNGNAADLWAFLAQYGAQ
ncbi:cytochrome C [Rhodobacteraceae bacterium WD3A24]|nr:cytochrome C [Rhodobacteraceae bacterium WD3A24]